MASRKLIQKADRIFSKYIRMRDSEDGFFICCSCGQRKPFEQAAESADENMKNLLQYIYENQDGILEYRERMKKITHKIRIK